MKRNAIAGLIFSPNLFSEHLTLIQSDRRDRHTLTHSLTHTFPLSHTHTHTHSWIIYSDSLCPRCAWSIDYIRFSFIITFWIYTYRMSARLWTEEQFNCPVCLDLPSDPVTIPCGHSYCTACISDYWDNEGRKNSTYSCPECRQTFNPRPALCRNTMLAEAVEQLRRGTVSSTGRESIKSARSAASSASERARTRSKAASKKLPGSAVPCDRCPESRAAVKTCLVCMASFCETHLKPHNAQEKLKNHELIAPTRDLSQKICPEHKYLQEFFCRSCQMYVCWLCTSNQHKGHESVSTQAERNEKQVGATSLIHNY